MMTHIKTLLGRVFLIAQPTQVQQWNGCKEKDNGETDYDLLEGFISYDEGDLTVFVKRDGLVYFVYFSMSSKIEIFKIENGIVLCDGLYFNESWEYTNKITFEVVAEKKNKVNITENSIYIFDAAIDGESISTEIGLDISSRNSNSMTLIDLENGIYNIKRVTTSIVFNNQDVLLQGIEISR